MLPPLVVLSFVLGMQVSAIQASPTQVPRMQAFSGDEYLPSPEDLAYAIQQAQEIREEANSMIHKGNLFQGKKPQNGCFSQLLKGGKSQGCLKNKTSPALQDTPQNNSFAIQKEKGSQILVFVSFSMPEASLKSLAQAAKKSASVQGQNAVLVIRGLYQDSFVQTASKFQELGIAVDIHPELFETHHVTSVPTFVELKDGQPIHTLKGNVTLDFVMKTFEGQRVNEVS